mgnify:CR=1 FL=1
MIKILALLTMFGAMLAAMILSSVMFAFITNNFYLTLLVVGVEIVSFFAAIAHMDYIINKA